MPLDILVLVFVLPYLLVAAFALLNPLRLPVFSRVERKPRQAETVATQPVASRRTRDDVRPGPWRSTGSFDMAETVPPRGIAEPIWVQDPCRTYGEELYRADRDLSDALV